MEIDPWDSKEVKNYTKLMQEFGIEDFKPVVEKIPEPHYLMRRGIIFGHRDYQRILDCIKNKKRFVMMTGLMPSGKFHLGHKTIADQIIYYQKIGAKIYLCVADVEAYNMRMASLEKLRETAIEEYLINYIALGLKRRGCDFYFQSERSGKAKKSNAYYRLATIVSRAVTFNEMRAIYGELSPGKIISVMMQVSDILHPQLKEFEKPIPTLVPVGIDQDPHLRLTRDIAARFQKTFRFIPPSSTYTRFMRGLKGGKMSSSDPSSYIALTDNPEEAAKKIMSALTGGKGNIKEQREYGGVPEFCTVFDVWKFHADDDKLVNRIYNECRSGERICGDCKKECAEFLKRFLKEHQRKRKKARKIYRKFLE
ncbi:MAG: tryptophan--tRNA ligase [Candidatus Aenigmatarchaeota archaeon]|nr:MAG: tryptophan--tRNA ligase [Candidatus Aenigmarchaeota archaeon]